MKRGSPTFYWRSHLYAWIEGRTGGEPPYGWTTSRGKPRCVRCTVPLNADETARLLSYRVRSCDDCFTDVKKELEEHGTRVQADRPVRRTG